MSQIKIRPEGQITIPAEILQAWSLQTNDMLDINLINGVVSLTPVKSTVHKKSIRSYAGIARGLWGDNAEAVDAFIGNERDSWEK